MAEYAFYIWSSYGLALIVIGLMVAGTLNSSKKAQKIVLNLQSDKGNEA